MSIAVQGQGQGVSMQNMGFSQSGPGQNSPAGMTGGAGTNTNNGATTNPGTGDVQGPGSVQNPGGSGPAGSQPGQQQQPPQQKELNAASLCRFGQETVQELVNRCQEIFACLRVLQVI